MNHVANMLWLPVTIGYVRTDGWLFIRLKKITGDFFSSNIESQCRFVIKRGQGHIFTIPKIEGVVTAMISEYPCKCVSLNNRCMVTQ